ncbi:uncharacterized protein J4E88_009515 [Alternaria novae-zelandiae]|uniref:uncharacterized protein n=1 Tax=Alternaria novae-zelandiae TaxID=430562 RepID=UPI0020C30F65|nr:uncharacterized protein J4E88_009515 [Alternaria novae-zelandiae]KAI4671117.1 hypothetical protein J4E88_009515 [Alternaria novae-zelandiae]
MLTYKSDNSMFLYDRNEYCPLDDSIIAISLITAEHLFMTSAGLSGEDLWPAFDDAGPVAASAKYGLSGIDMRFGIILAKLGNVI